MSILKALKTPRLWLRPTGVEDAEFLYQLMNTPDWLRFIGDRKIYSVQAAHQYIIEKIQPQHQRLGFGGYTIYLRSSDIKVGVCGLYDRDGLQGVDIGFALLPEYMGQGYAWEAARCLKESAVAIFGLPRLLGVTRPDNQASQRLLERLGMQRSGLIQLSPADSPLWLYVLDFKVEGPM